MTTPFSLAGRVAADPELRFPPDGKPVTKFTVVTSRRMKNDQSGEWEEKDTGFWDCVAYGQLATYVAESLRKGTGVLVSGRPAHLEAQDGSKRRPVEVVVDDVALRELVIHHPAVHPGRNHE